MSNKNIAESSAGVCWRRNTHAQLTLMIRVHETVTRIRWHKGSYCNEIEFLIRRKNVKMAETTSTQDVEWRRIQAK